MTSANYGKHIGTAIIFASIGFVFGRADSPNIDRPAAPRYSASELARPVNSAPAPIDLPVSNSEDSVEQDEEGGFHRIKTSEPATEEQKADLARLQSATDEIARRLARGENLEGIENKFGLTRVEIAADVPAGTASSTQSRLRALIDPANPPAEGTVITP